LRSFLAPSIGTVWPAHEWEVRLGPDSPAFRPLHSISLQLRRSPVRLAPAFPFHCVPTATNSRDRREHRALPNGVQAPPARESGQLSHRCRAGKLYIGKCGSHRRETVRPHSKNRQWADTTAISLRARFALRPCRPCGTHPDAPPDGKCVLPGGPCGTHRGVSINGRAQPRRARTNPMLARAARTAKTKLWLCGRLTCRMLPGSHTRDVICKAAPFSVSQRVPPANGSPPSSRRSGQCCKHRLAPPDGPVH
jgi:hypothetical protein